MLAFAKIWLAWQNSIEPEDQPLIDAAVEAIARARALNPDSVLADYAEAYYHYYVERDYARAINKIQPIIDRFPNNADYLSARLAG